MSAPSATPGGGGPAAMRSPTVVLLHGAGDSPVSWLLVRERLGADVPVLTVHRTPAHPQASRSDGQMLLDRHMDEISGAVSHAPGSVVLVGHSFGGLLARAWAHRHPLRVSGLVLVDATPPQAAESRSVAVGMATSALLMGALTQLDRLPILRILMRARLHPMYPEHRHAATAMTPAQERIWRDAVLQVTSGRAAEELASVHRLARLINAESSPLSVPALVVASRAYGRRWVAWQQQVADELGAPLRLSGDRSHNIHLRHPELVADAVREILAASGRPR